MKLLTRYLVALLPLFVCAIAPANAESRLAAYKGAPTAIEVVRIEAGRSYAVRFKLPKNGQTEAFLLESPSRLVIDVTGAHFPKNQSYTVSGDPVVQSVRLGTHPQKLRIVLDLADDFVAKSVINQRNGKVEVRLTTESVSGEVLTPDALGESVAAPTVVPAKPTIVPAKPTLVLTKPTAAPEPTVEQAPTHAPAPSAHPAIEEKHPVTDGSTPADSSDPLVAEILGKKAPPVKEPTSAPKATQTAKPTRTPKATQTPKSTATVKPTRTPVPPAPTIAPTVEPAPEQATPAVEEADKEPAPIDPAAAVVRPETPDSGPIGDSLKQRLVDIKFDYQIQDRAPLLRIVLLATSNFNLVKKDAKTYHLVLPQCGIKERSLTLPQFPPHDFIGFNLVKPEFSEGSTTVTIGVDRGMRISAFARGNEVWIKTLNK